MANPYILMHKAEFDSAIDHFKEELKSLRTGRAHSGMVENVQVEAYGAIQPLSQLASLSIPENNAIAIAPWDKSILKDIENALQMANLGLSLTNTGEKVIAKVPLMTEEIRKDMVKLLGKKAEDARVRARQVRDEVKDRIVEAEKNKELTEDDRYQHLAELDNFIADLNKQIEELREEKEEEIMTV